jgi:thymidylate synthase|tara:strand:+ start:6035 stop:7921 length:1887 start_codon:yes stop_codon:yes gene_type:complete
MKCIEFGRGRFAYVDLPKVACTSIKQELYRIEGYEITQVQDIHKYFAKRVVDSKGKERIFLIIRDPIKRFLSAYGNRVGFHYEISKGYIENNYPNLLKEIKIFNPGIGQFIDELDVYLKVPAISYHTIPVCKLLKIKDLKEFTDIYPIEQISSFKDEVRSITGKDFQLGRKQVGGRKIQLKDLSRSQMEKLIDFYKDDYNLLKDYYTVDELWKEWSDEKSLSQNFTREQMVRMISFYKDDYSLLKNSYSVDELWREWIKDDNSLSEGPFIIWTLRRSGGTNLSTALFEASDFSGVQHEPYNKGRMFGYIQDNWEAQQKPQVLVNEIAKTLAGRPLIKHCAEIIPMAVNMALISESKKMGYKHLFLYRENAKDRLLSLNFAQLTNVWGKEKIPESGMPGAVFNQNTPVERLISHEEKCRKTLTNLHQTLIETKQDVACLSFEQLYSRRADEARKELLRVIKFLELKEGFFTEEVLSNILNRGSQGTKQDYLKFGRASELVKKAEALPIFTLNQQPNISLYPLDKSKYFIHCEIWDIETNNGKIVLSGVILADGPINIWAEQEDGHKIFLESGLISSRIGRLYPDINKSDSCRFESKPFSVHCNMKLMVQLMEKELVLAEIFYQQPVKVI